LKEENEVCGEYKVFENIHDLIVVIVKKGLSDKVLDSAKEAGAEGGTIIFGRGTGIHEKGRLLGIPIEPEKEIIFIIIDKGKTKKVLDNIVASVNLNKPGVGVAFVIELSKVLGICHGLDCEHG